MDSFIKSTCLERFKLINFTSSILLGDGASGSVYKHCQENKDYAIKVFSLDDWEIDDFYEDLLWQTQIINQMGQLQNSIHFYGYDIIKIDNVDIPVFIMEYLKNDRDLYEYINKTEFWEKSFDKKNGYSFKSNKVYNNYVMSYKLKKDISKKMIESVKELHSKRVGIIHGDIKTSNMILAEDNKLKLIDFGASIFSEECILCKTDWHHGTLGYAAPEDSNGYLLGKPSDIYSLGISLIELWSGKIWYDGEDFKVCRNEVLKSLRMIEKNNPNIGKIIRKMIMNDSVKRSKIEEVQKSFDLL